MNRISHSRGLYEAASPWEDLNRHVTQQHPTVRGNRYFIPAYAGPGFRV